MTFEEARTFRMPFGKYKGSTLDEVASTDEGLRYLDWLVGRDLYPETRLRIEAYLADPTIRRALEEAIDE